MPLPFKAYRFSLLRRYCVCKRGATAVEFAIIAPVFLLLIMGIFELGMIFFVNMVMEGASGAVSRIGKTGYVPEGTTSEDYLREKVEELSSGLLDPSKLVIQRVWYRGFTNVGEPEPCFVETCTPDSPVGTYDDINGDGRWSADQGTPLPTSDTSIALYRISYPWTITTPLMSYFFPTDPFLITTAAVVKAE